jgi:DNA helicase-2/ATP-dependent DNA helicase PcrA
MRNETILKMIAARHSSDPSQIRVIETQASRLFVEAPAGYGKTTTMTSKAIHLLANGAIPYPKKILCLTFSVNAAHAMRTSIDTFIDSLPCDSSEAQRYRERIEIHNYHGFCRRFLKANSHLLLKSTIDFPALRMVDTAEAKKLHHSDGSKLLDDQEIAVLGAFDEAICSRDSKRAKEALRPYTAIVCEKMIPSGHLSYNGLIAMTICLLEQYPEVRRHLQSLYRCILVDEAQDMNILFLSLLNRLVCPSTRIALFGDTIQRIYGFMGAIPDMVSCSEACFGTDYLPLTESHRFSAATNVSNLEKAIRNASSGAWTACNASAPLIVARDSYEEAAVIADMVETIDADSKVAILYRSRGPASETLVNELSTREISFFDGTFKDEDPEFIRFNNICLKALMDERYAGNEITRHQMNGLLDVLASIAGGGSFVNGRTYRSLIEALGEQLESEYRTLGASERYDYLWHLFAENALKSVIGHVSERVVVPTVHASKGLEWDYAVIPSMNQYGFPAPRFCYGCSAEQGIGRLSSHGCSFRNGQPPEGYEEELSAFYVASTRAKKAVIFTMAKNRLTSQWKNQQVALSCLLQLPGIEVKRYFDASSILDYRLSEEPK